MCGIVGYVGYAQEGKWGESHRLLTELLVQSMERGTDATGFAALTAPLDAPYNHRAIGDKLPLPASEFTTRNQLWCQLRNVRCSSVVGHVRFATTGAPSDNRNNHPFKGQCDGRPFALVHNGHFLAHKETADRLALKCSTATDSEIAARLIEKTGDFALGLHRCLTEIKGSMALAVQDQKTGTVWFVRDSQRPLWICRLADRRRIIFASTPEIIERAVEKTLGKLSDSIHSLHPLASGYVHALTPDGELIAPYVAAARLAEW